MVAFRRAVFMAAVLLFMIFYLYPRQAPSPPQQQQATSKSPPPPPPPPKAVGPAQTQQKLSLLRLAGLSVEQQLAYHFPYDVTSKFPAYIWQTWKYTPASDHFSEKLRSCEASWTERHPTFVHEVITDQVALQLIKHLYAAVPDVLAAYLAMPLPILKADFFRYLILLARGGVYADIDTIALKPTTEWIPSGFNIKSIGLVIGIEADPDREDWADWYSRRIQFCQWTIKSKPGHPVLRSIVARITAETLQRRDAGTLGKVSVVEFTGPAAWTDRIFQYFNDPTYFDIAASAQNITFKNFTGMKEPQRVGDVVVLPITSFSPGIGHSGAGEVDDPMAFVKHEFEGSWKPDSERHIGPDGGA